MEKYSIATFAGGCFWCTESAFDGHEGIADIIPGYIGGQIENPSYDQVCTGTTGHYEAIRITFNPGIISYQTLLEIFFGQIDPTDSGGAFVDRGSQYRSAVFYHDDEQKQTAEEIIHKIDASGLFDRPVATKLIKASAFYPAEDYHHGYHRKNAVRYRYYRAGSGRDIFIEKNKGNYLKIFNR